MSWQGQSKSRRARYFQQKARKYKNDIKQQANVLKQGLFDDIDYLEASLRQDITDEVVNEVIRKSLTIAPEKTGDLIASFKTETLEERDGYKNWYIAYQVWYAGFVHDNANRGHDYIKPTTPDTHWHFLTDPLADVKQDIDNIMAAAMKKRTKELLAKRRQRRNKK